MSSVATHSSSSSSTSKAESFAALFEESLNRQEMKQGEVITAEVIRVEPRDPPDSLAHAYRNANKRGVVLDVHDAADRARLDELLADAR